MSTMVGQPPPVVPVARKAPAPFRARLGEYVFVLPALVIVLAVMGYPFIYSIYLSFQATPVNSIGGFSIFLAGKAAGFRPSTQGGKSRLRA